MWSKNHKNIPLNRVALLPSQRDGIIIMGDSCPDQQRGYGTQWDTVPSVFPENPVIKELLQLVGKVENVVTQERGVLADQPLTKHLKEHNHSMTADKQRVHFDDNPNFIQEFVRKLKAKASLLRIKKKINRLAHKIDAPRKLRPSYGSFDYEMDSYFIEIDQKGVMRLIETEKGQVHEVRRTRDLDELLYWIFTNITFSMAYIMAIEKPIGSMDRRKLIFQFQEELLAKLNPQWKDKIHAEYKEFLKNHPTDDIKGKGPEYYEALRKQIRGEIVEKSASYFRFPTG